MVHDSVLATVRTIVAEAAPGQEIADDTPLIARRIIDSLSLLTVVSRLEASLDIKIDDTEILPTHFETITAIRSFLTAKGR
ncbi:MULTISPECIES: acyl carrier protein [unclassified Streptomyces]|uniref:acyl carrier protein n=1 Tax=unclassified Streptomyces TaxID=2593676 RepID=UPI002365243E|nr:MULTISPECIES: acyl carrier protein [unclassified Streptomyces]MDF3142783.1 acyl carrier protein [Streptomyces sp. T21Q-yed]WDF42870.1 acyl carrier protein [Streptomyces sp. T12]